MDALPAPMAIEFHPRLADRRRLDALFHGVCIGLAVFCVVALAVLIVRIVIQGWPYLTTQFLRSYPSTLDPGMSGIRHALFGTLWLMACCAFVSVPLGLGAAIYLSEYAADTRITRFIQINIANLAGVPSIVYGILGLAIFVRWLAFGRHLIAGGLTLSLLILPVIIISAREALSAVPSSLRQASFALGATRWQTIRHHVLPVALPGFMTGVILSLSRAIGEAAPIMVVGAKTVLRWAPGDHYAMTGPALEVVTEKIKNILMDDFSALPLIIYYWADRPSDGVHDRLAAAAIVVLLVGLLSMNAVAVAIRLWFQRKPMN